MINEQARQQDDVARTTLPALNSPSLPSIAAMFGTTPAMAAIQRQIRKVANVNIPVLLTGESGTGKGVVASLIHCYSAAAHSPFVQINCAALPTDLIESELFGYEKGSFTGANAAKLGRLEMAGSGTVFLDEIGEMDARLQAKLLHVLQDGHFSRIGATQEQQVCNRFIFATNRNLQQEIAAGNFRQDLFYRMEGITIHLPALRERAEDIPALVEYFLQKYGQRYATRIPAISPEIMDRLQAYHWPGNIRQLENLIRRYVVLGSEQAALTDLVNSPRDVFQFTLPPNVRVSLKEITRQAVRQVERQVIEKALHATGWNRKRAAKMLGISYRAFLYKLEEARICCPTAVDEQTGVTGFSQQTAA
ncbi:MAG TPA: sigma-54 dependent transcriptional regulator [Terriglobales bacterium]|nr:sigma-54 dependent transcriptional regulator [Terriglobales bacterium]